MVRLLRLCHLSDPHVAVQRTGSLVVLEALLRDALARGADHVLLTGDVIDRPGGPELSAVRRLLRGLGLFTPERVTVLPGNHDASGHPGEGGGPAARRRALAAFLHTMREVNRDVGGRGRRTHLAPGRPIRKRLGPLDLVALCTASDHHDVEGRALGSDLAALDRAFAGRTARTRVVAVHHHPYPLPVGPSAAFGRLVPEGLLRGPDLLDLCAARAVDLVLHGHIHASGGPFDRTIRGVKVRCQGTAKGERRADGHLRFGYDLYVLGGPRLVRRRRFLSSAGIVDGLLEVDLEETGPGPRKALDAR